MPLYCYKCPGCEHKTERFRHLSNANAVEKCPECGRSMEKDIAAQRVGSGNTEFTKPIEMHSIALCNDVDIAEFRRRNPDVSIGTDPARDDYGVPKARTRKEKLDILEKEGYEEVNGYG